MIIVIDDERTFKESTPGYVEVLYARNSNEGIAILGKYWADYVIRYGNRVDLYLDHDLGENDTIMPVVDFLYVAGCGGAKNSVGGLTDVIANIFVHSQNPTAADKIVPLLAPFYENVKQIPLPELI